MHSKRHPSARSHRGEPAAHPPSSPSALFETLESRQLMSVAAPTMESTGAMLAADPAGAASYAPLAAPGTAATDAPAADAAGVTVAAPGDGTVDPPPPPSTGDDGTAEARSLWDRLKGAAKWVKNHVTATLHSIGIKGTF